MMMEMMMRTMTTTAAMTPAIHATDNDSHPSVVPATAVVSAVEVLSAGSKTIDWVNVLRPTRHKLGHFGDVLLPSQSLGLVLKN